jgi:hypothetical protein
MGFALVSLGLLVLVIMIIVYKSYLSLNDNGSSQTYFRALF